VPRCRRRYQHLSALLRWHFAADHGLTVRAFAIRVVDAKDAFHTSITTDACPTFEPVGLDFRLVKVQLYGDVVLRYMRSSPRLRSPLLLLG
jgi:4-hydroxyphenylpyruvate dioxygenase-like putative hemolysin